VKVGICFLVMAYTFSQFYRAFLAVLAPVLEQEIGATAADLARASGLWFAAFALMQLPVGWALDRLGPRRTTAVLFGVCAAGGAALFALAQGPGAIQLAMTLIGIGCAPVLMASYFIFARQYPSAVFGTLAGLTVGISSLGNIASALPMALAVEAFGWRASVWVLAAATALIALAIARLVKDPDAPDSRAQGSLFDILKTPAIWLILPMMFVSYGPTAGIRGLWITPYISDRFDADLTQIGNATLLMSLAMVVGSLAYGPMDRLFGTRKWVILGGNLVLAGFCFALWLLPPADLKTATALFVAIGLFGSSYPMVIAHGRSFFPPHLIGRGVTLLNLFGMGGAGVVQFLSAPAYLQLAAVRGPADAYGMLFAVFGLIILVGLTVYLFSEDRTD